MFLFKGSSSGKRIPNDSFAHERAMLDTCFGDIVSLRRSMERFEESLCQLNPMHVEFEARLVGFCAPDRDLARKESMATRLTASIGSGFAGAKSDYVLARSNLDKMEEELKTLLARLLGRDQAYWSESHYEAKVSKLQRSGSISEKMNRNLQKLHLAKDGFKQLNDPVVTDCKLWLDTRFAKMQLILQMYLSHVRGYYGGVYQCLSSEPKSPGASTADSPSLMGRLLGKMAPEVPVFAAKQITDEEEYGAIVSLF